MNISEQFPFPIDFDSTMPSPCDIVLVLAYPKAGFLFVFLDCQEPCFEQFILSQAK